MVTGEAGEVYILKTGSGAPTFLFRTSLLPAGSPH